MTIQRFCRWVSFSLVVLLVTTSHAHAQTIGNVITDLTTSFISFPTLLTSLSYIMGCSYIVWGILKFKDHVDDPNHTPLSSGVKRFLSGGMFLALHFMVDVVRKILFDGLALVNIKDSGFNPAPLGGMEKMIHDLVANIAGPMTILLTSFTYIAGIILLIVGISRMIKTAQDGPRGPAGLGTVMTLFVAGALISGAGMITAFTSTLFGDSTVSTFANISPAVIANAADRARLGALIESLMTFIMIVGIIAFIRGLFVLRAFAEGSQNATIMQALTFLFGGALAINLGDLVNVLGATVGVVGLTFT